MDMALVLSFLPTHLLWSCVELYATGIRCVSPSKRVRRMAEDIAVLSSKFKEQRKSSKDTAADSLKRRLNHAASLVEYEKCTTELDHLQGHDRWKQEKKSIEPEYNPDVIETHMRLLQKAAHSSDLSAMQFLLRTGLSRELGGMNMLRLYKHSWFGTKYLIDDYTNTAIETIDKFVDGAVRFNIPTSEVRFYQQSLEDALKYFGRSALTLSGGALLGMKHIGVVKCLWEADLLPEIISGASAGSIVAAVVGSATDERMAEVLEYFPDSDLAVFDPAGTGTLGWLKQRITTFVTSGAFFNMDNLKKVMQQWLGDMTFREAHYKTGRLLNICVSTADSNEPRLLNYVTAPDVYLWSAVCASCAVPGVFPPSTVYEKDPVTKQPQLWMENAQQLFVDGSLDHDIPMRKLSEMFNVNFFIVSQVNPHVRTFLEPEELFRGSQSTTPAPRWSFLQTAKALIRQEVIHRAQQAADLGLPPHWYRWASVLNQQYTGDINILPEIHPHEYFHMMMNPTPQFMLDATMAGERATWPKMCRIKNCVAIELALLRAIHLLRDRVNFGPEARAAREARQVTKREPAQRGRSARPVFLRRRSLSIESPTNGSPGQPAATPLTVRRNLSLGSIAVGQVPMSSATTPKHTLSPQTGVDQELLGDALTMTSLTTSSDSSSN